MFWKENILAVLIGVVCYLAVVPLAKAQPGEPTRLITITDSIGAASYSWNTQLPEYNVHRLSQGGRTVAGYTLPTDLVNASGTDIVVYSLGTGDILKQVPIANTFTQVLNHLVTLSLSGFDVVLVTPPMYNIPQFDEGNALVVWLFNNITIPGVRHCDLGPVWASVETWDGIHPTPSGSQTLAGAIRACVVGE